MWNRTLVVAGTRTEHIIRVANLYQFVTVFNHSEHTLSFFPDHETTMEKRLFRVLPQTYVTIPIMGVGGIGHIGEFMMTIVSEGINITPTQIGMFFTETSLNINLATASNPLISQLVNHPGIIEIRPRLNDWRISSAAALGTATTTLFTRSAPPGFRQIITAYDLSMVISGGDLHNPFIFFQFNRDGVRAWRTFTRGNTFPNATSRATGLYIDGGTTLALLVRFVEGLAQGSAEWSVSGFDIPA